MRPATRAAAAAVRLWSHIYTLGLPSQVADRRRETIAADICDQVEASRCGRSAQFATAVSLLLRLLLGVPADLSWRLSPSLHQRPVPIVFSAERYAMAQSDVRMPLPAFAGFSCALVLVLALEPVPHSLAYAGLALGLVALTGWCLEARSVAQPTASGWPVLAAMAVGALAGGLLLDSGRAGLLIAVPMAVASSGAWLATWRQTRPEPDSAAVPQAVLQARKARGDAIAVETLDGRRLSRRTILRGGAWLGIGSVLAAGMATVVDFLWQRSPEAFGGIIDAGTVDRYPPGSKTKIQEGKFWLVHLTAEQGGPGFLALWQKCPHLGCTVPWLPGFRFSDPATGETTQGWFRCPCHQSTYNDAGVRVYGPAPRSMDRMQVTIDQDSGRISVDTGSIARGGSDNASFAVPPP